MIVLYALGQVLVILLVFGVGPAEKDEDQRCDRDCKGQVDALALEEGGYLEGLDRQGNQEGDRKDQVQVETLLD